MTQQHTHGSKLLVFKFFALGPMDYWGSLGRRHVTLFWPCNSYESYVMQSHFYSIVKVEKLSGWRCSFVKPPVESLSSDLRETWGKMELRNYTESWETSRWLVGEVTEDVILPCKFAIGDDPEYKLKNSGFCLNAPNSLTLPCLSVCAMNSNLCWQGAMVLLFTASGGQPSTQVFHKQGWHCFNTLLLIFAN